MQDEENARRARVDAAVAADVPHLSANGLALMLTNGDIMLSLEQNNRPVGTLNLSFTVAKTLAVILGNAIADLESMSGRPIMTTHEIDQMMVSRTETKKEALKEKAPKSKARKH